VAWIVGGAALIAVLAIVLVLSLGGDDKKDDAKGSPSPSTSSSNSSSPSKSPTSSPSSSSSTPTRTPSTSARPTTGGPTDDGDNTVEKITMVPGDCVVFPANSSDINKVSCTTPHDAEHVRNVFMTDGPWPGDAEAERQAENLCDAAVAPVISKQPNSSQLGTDFIYPAESGWDNGDREVQCLVKMRDNSKLTAPLKK
jgi:hypothetical protein